MLYSNKTNSAIHYNYHPTSNSGVRCLANSLRAIKDEKLSIILNLCNDLLTSKHNGAVLNVNRELNS